MRMFALVLKTNWIRSSSCPVHLTTWQLTSKLW